MAVRTDTLVHGATTQGPSNLVTLATVPANEVWLVRQIQVDNRTGATTTYMVTQLRSGTDVKWAQGSLAQATVASHLGLWLTAEAGDLIRTLSTVAGIMHWSIHGSRLLVP